MRISDWSSDVCSSDLFHAQVRMTLHRANPAALRHDDRDGLPLDHGFQRDFPCRRCFLYRRAAAAKLRLRTITFSQRCQVFLEPRALPRRAFDQLHQPFALGSELIPFAPELHFLQLSQGPQPHVENRSEEHTSELQSLMRTSYA